VGGSIVIIGGGGDARGFVIRDVDEDGKPLPDAPIAGRFDRDTVRELLEKLRDLNGIFAAGTEDKYPTASAQATQSVLLFETALRMLEAGDAK
jgi:hypothetical protein